MWYDGRRGDPMNPMKIFVVEDDGVIADAVCRHLESWGYPCVRARDLTRVTEEFVREQPQLVILDIGLPSRNGYHWCGEIRKLSQVPILFLSSAADNMNIVMAIDRGGDDFVAKPFDLAVLTAKVQALLRRTYDFTPPGELLTCGGVTLRVADGTAHSQGRSVELTRNEQRILQTLFRSKGRVVSREELMQRLWETDCFVDSNTLTVNMTRLRKKLAQLGAEELIVTRKNEGYLVP